MDDSTTAKTLHLLIHGRVQGVSYRYSMLCEAHRAGVTGWVRNRGDGTVEATLQGPSAAVDAMLQWAQRGPSLARVERVDVAAGAGAYDIFEVR